MKVKRLSAIIMIMVMFIMQLSALADSSAPAGETAELFSSSGTCGDNLSWVLDDDGTLTISGSGAMTSWSQSSDTPWFSEKENIKSVVIENGVTSIGDFSFKYCTSLTSVTIPDSVTSIGNGAFYHCENLISVTIPNSVTSIRTGAFVYCSSLSSVTIPDSVTSIGQSAFEYCSNLASVTILSKNATFSIYKGVFSRCSSDLVINGYSDSTAKTYASNNSHTFKAFTESGTCGNNLSWALTDDSTLYIYGSGAMTDWENSSDVPWCEIRETIKSVIIGDNVTSIGSKAFVCFTQIPIISIPNRVTKIGDKAFRLCTNLENIIIPSGVTSIGNGAFEYCPTLASATILSKNATFGTQVFYSCSSDLVINGYSGSTAQTYAKDNNHTFKAIDEPTVTTTATPLSDTLSDSGTSGVLSWNVSDDTLTLSGSGTMLSYTDGNAPWNNYKSQIKHIVINEGIVNIGDYAFSGLANVVDCSIPSSIETIGNYAFYGCNALTSIDIPDNVTDIGSFAFYRCTGLTNITLPYGITSINNYTFEFCSGLTSVYIPNSVTNIGTAAFYGCKKLTSLSIPDTVTNIENYAFYGCSVLTSATILYKTATFGKGVFSGCSADLVISGYSGSTAQTYAEENSITFNALDKPTVIPDTYTITYDANGGSGEPSSQTKIQGQTLTLSSTPPTRTGYTFLGWATSSSATSAEYKVGTTFTIDADTTLYAVWKSEKTEISDTYTITYNANGGSGAPSSQTKTQGQALTLSSVQPTRTGYTFLGWATSSSATSAVYQSGASFTTDADTTLYAVWKSTASNNTENSSLKDGDNGTINSIAWTFSGDTLTLKGSGTMLSYTANSAPWSKGKTQIKHIVINEGITNIGDYAFAGLEKVVDCSIPSTVETIGNYAFNGCTQLTSPTLPQGLKSIGENAFNGCSAIKEITVPDKVDTIASGAFGGCTSLEKITLPFIGSEVGSKNNTNTFSYIFGTVPNSLKTVIITKETNMPEKAFENCTNIKTISVNDEVKTIGASAFYGCSALTGFTVPDGVTDIADYTFYGCKSAESIVVPDSVQAIGVSAFEGCAALTDINIPNGVKEIKDNTFKDCAALTKITIPDSVEYIGTNVLDGCNKLYTMIIPFVGASRNNSTDEESIFGYLFGKTDNTQIPASVTKVEVTNDKNGVISAGAFENCQSICDIIIDNGYSVLKGAFKNCRNLKTLYLSKDIKDIGDCILENCTNLRTLTVPFIGSDNNDKNTKTSVLGAFFGYSETQSGKLIKQYYKEDEYLFYYVPETLKNVTVLREVNLPYGAFMNCQNIEQISIITGAVISDKAFYDCVSLKKISLPKNTTSIGKEAFSGCETLECINIPANTTSIGESAFYNANIKEITIPATVTNIDDSAFNGAKVNVIVCSKSSAADIFAKNNNIEPKYVDEKMLDVKKTLTAVDVHSDNSLFFDITDTNGSNGNLFVVLYDAVGNMIAIKKITADANNSEYKVTFTEDEYKNAAFAKIFIWADDTMASQTSECEKKDI